MLVKIVDRTDVSDPTKREGFSAYKLDSFESFFQFLSNGMYIRSIFYIVVLILDKGGVPRNVEIKFF